MPGSRGPQRKVGSVRWNREVRKKQKLALIDRPTPQTGQKAPVALKNGEGKLPTCPAWLSKPVAERWLALVTDMAAAGVPLKEIDSRAVAVAAGYEGDLAGLEAMSANPTLDAEGRLVAIRLKNATRKDYLAALQAIGGTPLVRLRAGVAPAEKPKVANEWADV
jgi:hypothetical protein